jgi:methionyl-tRNA formyltransferase
MKIVFFGTPEFAVPTLKKLISENFEVVAVVTMADRPAHRGQKDQPSPVKVVAEQHKIPVYYEIPTPEQLKNWGAEKIVVIAYGKMIPAEIYKNWHSLNVHPSKLPQYRGPSPLQSALLNGDSQTAVTIMLIDKEMDAGDIILQEEMDIDQNENLQSLHDRAAERGAELMIEGLKLDLEKIRMPQDHAQATRCKKIKKEDSQINWNDSPQKIHNIVRAIGGFTIKDGKRVKILKTHIKDNKLEILEVQPEGKKEMDALSFWNGARLSVGDRFVEQESLKGESHGIP